MIARRERHWMFLPLPRRGINQQQLVAAAIIVEPGQDHIVTLPIHRRHRPAVIADRHRHAVVKKTVPQIFTRGES